MDGGIFDVLVLGGGPAGIAAALTARARGRRVTVLSNDPLQSPLAKARQIDNYPGLTGVGGDALLRAMTAGLESQSIPLTVGRAVAIMPAGGRFMVSAGQDIRQAKSLILATGAAADKPFPGERELLGAGVSYCATCDGMLYRGKAVAVIDLGADGAAEAAFLKSIGCGVTYFDRKSAARFEILGQDRVTGLAADGVEYPVDGVFILRRTVAAPALLHGLAMQDGHIRVDEAMRTSVPGVFAAGDCTGRPYQVARAVGQGNIAALSADTYLKETEKL